jgi:hypothetical protein
VKFSIYGRFQVGLQRRNGQWTAFRLEGGKRVSLNDIVIPDELEEPTEIARYLDDLFHELSGPGDRIEMLS